MPKETPTPLSRGPGSVSQDFTAPSVGVSTPGRQLNAPTTEQEQFADAILMFGRGVASAVSARSAISQRLKSLKEQGMRKTEADLNRAARSFQAKRLEGADADRRNILVESREKGMEWAERQFRSRMTNAASGQEARMWETAWNGASALVERDNTEAQHQSFNNAKMAMREVSVGLSQELQESQELQQTLIGNGTGINARVQNWMLTRVQRDLDMEKLDEDDANFLIHQTIVQAAGIGDQLRSQHTKSVEDSNQRLGSRQIEADLFSTMTGEQEPGRLRTQIEVTLRDRFNHFTLEQQDDMVRELVAANLDRLANGEFGIGNFGSLDTARELVNATVNGRQMFTKAERQGLTASLLNRAQQTVVREFESRLSVAREQYTKIVTTADGTQVERIDLDADAKLIAPNDDGVSQLDLIADSIIGDIDPTSSPEASALVAGIREQQRNIHAGVARAAAKTQREWTTAVNVLTGGRSENPTSDGNLAFNLSPETRVMRTPQELAASGREALSAEEDRHLRQSYRQIAVLTGMDPALVDQWDGAVIGSDSPVRPLADVAQASVWNSPAVVASTGMPPALVRDKVSLLTSDKPEDLRSFGTFVTTLDGGPGGAYEKFMSSSVLTDQQRAQVTHVRTVLTRGRADYDLDGNPVIQDPTAEATDIAFLHSQVQALANVPNRKDWIYARPDGPRNPTNLETIAGYWADAIRSDDDPRMYSESDWNTRRDAMVEGITTAISNDSALADWVNSVYQSQSALDHTLDEGQVAATLKGWMERDGLRFKQTEDTVFLMQDPANHTGPPGEDLDVHANTKLTTPYPIWAREAIGEALGAKRHEIPLHPQGLYLYRRKGVVTMDGQLLPDASRTLNLNDANVEGLLQAHYGNTYQDAQRRLDSRTNLGGAILHAVTSSGERLQLPTAAYRVEFTYPDGTPGVIEEGQVIAFTNADFTPSPPPKQRSRKGGYGAVPPPSPSVYEPTSVYAPRVTPQANAESINVPSQ